MKKILLLLLVTCYSFAQTGTTTAGQFKMTVPVAGATNDSVVVWNGTDKKLKFIGRSTFGGGGTTPNLTEVLLQGNREFKEVSVDDGEEFYTFVQEDKSKIVFGYTANEYKIPKDVFEIGDELIFFSNANPQYPITSNEDVSIIIDEVIVNSVTCNVTSFLKFKHLSSNVWMCTKEAYSNETVVIDGNSTVLNNQNYVVISNSVITDPTGVENRGYTIFVRNGIATIGGVTYPSGSLVYRFYHSGSWSSTVIGGTVPDADASTKGIAKLYTDLSASNTDGSVTQSGIVTGLATKQDKPQILNLTSNYTLTSSTSAQKLFNVGTGGNGAFDATASTIYEFELFVDLSTLSSTSGFFSFSLTGTATYNNLRLKTSSTKTALISGSVFDGVMTTASAYQLTTASIATVGTMTIKGLINVNGAGTIIPTITLSQASAGVVLTNSYCKLTKI